MLRSVLLTFLALTLSTLAVTTGLNAIYQPLALYGTDYDSDEAEDGKMLQGVVMDRPMALSGAFPEVLVEAVSSSHKLASIGAYDEKEANLIPLCGVKVRAELGDTRLRLVIDLEKLDVPKKLELSDLEVTILVIEAIMRTFSEWGEVHAEEAEVELIVTGREELETLGTVFLIGKSKGR